MDGQKYETVDWFRADATHAIEASKIRRIPKARSKPTTRAVLRCSGGNFSTKSQ